jgi:hypothetical protein
MTTIWTRLGGTKFVAFLLLAVWGMWMIQTSIKPDPVLLDFVRYVFWGFMFGNVGAVGVNTAATYIATRAAAINGTAVPTTKEQQ